MHVLHAPMAVVQALNPVDIRRQGRTGIWVVNTSECMRKALDRDPHLVLHATGTARHRLRVKRGSMIEPDPQNDLDRRGRTGHRYNQNRLNSLGAAPAGTGPAGKRRPNPGGFAPRPAVTGRCRVRLHSTVVSIGNMVAQSKTRKARSPRNPLQSGQFRHNSTDEPPTAPIAVRHIAVTDAHEGQRLDNFLFRTLKGVPKSHVYRVVRSGEVRVNGGRAKAETRLGAGDEVRIPPLRLPAIAATAPAPARMPPVLYEDEHLLVIDKPAGVAAHGGSGVSHGIIERVRAALPAQPFLELGHRLDRETSGILLLAKTRRCLLALHEQMRQGTIDKRYLTAVVGDWVNDKQHVKARLTKRTTPQGEKRVHVDEQEGMAAHTVFYLRARLDGFSLLEAQLHTGRTHQIRVHLSHLGFVIIGDDKYGDFQRNREAAKGAFGARLDRMFLHAWRVRMAHPVTGAALDLEASLPADLANWLDARDPDGVRRALYVDREV